GVLAPRATRALLDHLATQPATAAGEAAARPASDPLAELTDRERDVFHAIAQGLSNSEIAESFFLSESTVKTHVGRVLAKLDARDRVHIVILAYQWGLAETG
ncbi:MAG: helix-turn-helix transcriptional regulator, partial [Microbacterium sp.]